MKKDNLLYLDHILDSFRKVIAYVKDVPYDTFVEDEEKQDAVIRKIEVAGEATKRLSKAFRESTNHIPWRAIAGLRDKLIHDYIDVDYFIVWHTIQQVLPSLEKRIDEIIEKYEA